eukprot:Nitzschia sp. Nitz4//scaffold52_size167869//97008//97694//NITZ4_002284-RA/size167869-processed-gene-0.132-mRNA-1//1//CDS//3329554059//7393//frame0
MTNTRVARSLSSLSASRTSNGSPATTSSFRNSSGPMTSPPDKQPSVPTSQAVPPSDALDDTFTEDAVTYFIESLVAVYTYPLPFLNPPLAFGYPLTIAFMSIFTPKTAIATSVLFVLFDGLIRTAISSVELPSTDWDDRPPTDAIAFFASILTGTLLVPFTYTLNPPIDSGMIELGIIFWASWMSVLAILLYVMITMFKGEVVMTSGEERQMRQWERPPPRPFRYAGN